MGVIVHCFVKSTFIYICDNVARLKEAGKVEGSCKTGERNGRTRVKEGRVKYIRCTI